MDDWHVKILGTANIAQLMVRYCVPTMLATSIQACYNIVDRIFVGRVCGEDALAAVTVCFSPQLLFLAISMMIGQGSAALLSIKLGQKDYGGASRVFSQAALLFVLFYIGALCILMPFMREILEFFGATPKIVDDAQAYYTIIVFGLIFEKISFGINNLIRAEGRPAYAMSTMFVGALSNIILDYVFMCVFDMGVRGAAYATVAAQALGSVWVMLFYAGGRSCLTFRLSDVKFHRDIIGAVCSAGSPSLIMQLLAGLGVSLYVKQACEFGSESTIAIVGVDFASTTIMFMPVVGLSMGVQPIIGYNWGARNPERVVKTFYYALAAATAFCTLAFVLAQLYAEVIFMLFFGETSSLITDGARIMRILVCCTPFIGANIVASGFFQSTKRPAYSVAVTFIRQALFLIPLLYLLPIYFGLDGLWASFPLSDFMAFLVTLVFILLKITPARVEADIRSLKT